jgi:hypothetical protein
MDRGDGTCARSLHQGMGAAMVDQVRIGACAEKRIDDTRVACKGRGHQRGALERGALIGRGAVLQQQLDACRIVLGNAGCIHQCGLRRFDMRLCTAPEQEGCDAPVGAAAGGAQRGHPFRIHRIHIRAGIEQQRGDDRFRTARCMMQWRIAVRSRAACIGAVREQGGDGFGTSLVAVARGRDQRRDAALDLVDVDTLGDQRAQQAEIGRRHGNHQDAALVPLGRVGQRIRIAAALERGEGQADLRRMRGTKQCRVELAATDARRQFRDFGQWVRHSGLARDITPTPRARIGKQRAQAAVGEQHMRERCNGDRVQGQQYDSDFPIQEPAQTCQCQGAHGEQQNAQSRRQAISEKQLVFLCQVARECQ